MERVRIVKVPYGYSKYQLTLLMGTERIGALVYGNPGSYMEVCYLSINPQYRRMGYATQLMERFFCEIRTYIGEIKLVAAANFDFHWYRDNTIIKQSDLEVFYEKFGFKVEKREHKCCMMSLYHKS